MKKKLLELEKYVRSQNWGRALSVAKENERELSGSGLYHALIGICYGSTEQNLQASQCFKKACELEPKNEHYWNNLGLSYASLGLYDQAYESYKTGIAIKPGFDEVYANAGAALIQLGRVDDAINLLEKKSKSTHRNILLNRTEAYVQAGQIKKARDVMAKLYQLYPNDTDVLSKVADSSAKIGDYSVASEVGYRYLEKSMQLNNSDLLTTIGSYFGRCNQDEKAIELAKMALEIEPDNGLAHYNLALSYLKLEQFGEAWRHNQWRMVPKERDYVPDPWNPARTLLKPSEYQGLNFYHKKVAFVSEQGIGDELFFIRFLKEIMPLKANYYYLPSSGSAPIFKYFSDIELIDSNVEDSTQFDYIFPIAEAALFATTLGVSSHVRPALFGEEKFSGVPSQLQNMPKPWIGVTWRAGMQTDFNQIREVDLNELLDSVSCAGTLVILQRNPTADELSLIRERGTTIVDCSSLNERLGDMVPVIWHLDDYIGVHNTNMHIRASCGKKAKLLNAYPGDVYIKAETDYSSWFPDFEILSESADSGWSGALDKLKQRIQDEYNR